ncbi:signal peptidase I [Candidatus Enterococcus ferrettii]|uniref:Signal peptidase I n=1 Tax=Candidatus Enterococcus ferrettii TaxID=2815324 RepID=A0ABV0ET52_9ENTE|nr:signal peptidase I [Enterococcus sp. 665A]MBO1340192.1 signal peptidase I [Enterococcus sp. 665A]
MAGAFVFCYLIFLSAFRAYYWLYPQYFVSGESMNPTFWEQEVVQVRAHHKPERFDVVVMHPPDAPTELYLKRVIGLPGERIDYQDGELLVNHEIIADMFAYRTEDFNWNGVSSGTIPKGYYFVLGDNRAISKDSRIFGLVSEKQILGIVQEGNKGK